MLPVGFKEFKVVNLFIFFAIFFFSLALSIDKRSILAKIWWGCSLPRGPPPPPPLYQLRGNSDALKRWNQLEGNFYVYLHAKNQLPLLTSFLRYCKDIANFQDAWHPHQNQSIFLEKTLMLFCIQKINFITHFFLILGNLGIADHTYLKW